MPFDDSDWSTASDIAKPDAAAAQTTADSASSAASAAQTTADSAQTTATAANTTATAAQTTADAASTTATTAKTTADSAQATATATAQTFWADSDGAHVSDSGDHSLTSGNLLLTSAALKIRSALTELSTFGADLIELGKNSTSAVISMVGGKFKFLFGTQYGSAESATIVANNSPLMMLSDCGSTASGEVSLFSATDLGKHKGSFVVADGSSAYLSSDPTTHTASEWHKGSVGVNGSDITVSGTSVTESGTEFDFSESYPLDNLRYVLSVYRGTAVVTTSSSGIAGIMDREATKSMLGRDFNNYTDIFIATDGDVEASNYAQVTGAYRSSDKYLVADTTAQSRTIRINWFIFAP